MSTEACESRVISCSFRTQARAPEIYAGDAAGIDGVLLDLILPKINGWGGEK